MPDVIRQLVKLQQQTVGAVAARIRKLETQDPATRIYIQPTDPGAVSGGSIWIDTASGVIAYRDDTDTSWLPIATVAAAVHSLTGVSHTVAGLTTGDILTALSAVTFGFALDPVIDLANALGDIVVATAADTLTILPRGNDGDVLYTDSGTATGLLWDVLPPPIPQTTIVDDPLWAALGDLAAGTGVDTAIILPRGVDGDVLYTDSGQASGLRWDVLPASAPHTILSASHSDTNVAAPSDDDVLTWDNGAGEWLAAPIPPPAPQTTIADDPIWANAGDIVVATGAGAASVVGIGGAGEVLTVVAGVPAWAVPAGGSGADPTLAIMNLLGWA